MQNNALNNCQYFPPKAPNAVDINIYSPQAYGNNCAQNPIAPQGNFYSMYGPNTQPNLPIYPVNYNNMVTPYQYYPQQQIPIQNPAQNGIPNNQANLAGNNLNPQNSYLEDKKTDNKDDKDKKDKDEKDKDKFITPLTDEYIKSLENYLNDSNPKIRLIGAKELLERLKEDENRKDNPSLIPLVNKVLQDSSLSVRFLGLTMLQLDYCTGDDKTVEILKQIQAENKDKVGENQLLASEILLKMSAPDKIKVEKGS